MTTNSTTAAKTHFGGLNNDHDYPTAIEDPSEYLTPVTSL